MIDALGLAPTSCGSTGTVYSDAQQTVVLKRFKPIYSHLTVHEREVCALQALRRFPWAPQLLCAGTDFTLTSYKGREACRQRLPAGYMAQVNTILSDLHSIGVRHNDIAKPWATDFVVDERNGRMGLVDYTWATINGSLSMKCEFRTGGKSISFMSRPNRVKDEVLDAGFANVETAQSVQFPECGCEPNKVKTIQFDKAQHCIVDHTRPKPCTIGAPSTDLKTSGMPSTTFKDFMQRGSAGSQQYRSERVTSSPSPSTSTDPPSAESGQTAKAAPIAVETKLSAAAEERITNLEAEVAALRTELAQLRESLGG